MMPDDILSALMSIGAVSKSRIDDILAFYSELGRRSGPTKFNRKCADGRTMAVNCTPVENGWILTFEDVTDLRRADERIAHVAHHDALTGVAEPGHATPAGRGSTTARGRAGSLRRDVPRPRPFQKRE